MDSVAAAIIAAIVAGGTAGLNETSKKFIAEAYDGLKKLLKSKYGEESEVIRAARYLESKPNSAGAKEMLKEELAEVGADKDSELRAAADAVLERIKTRPANEQILQTLIGNKNVAVVNGIGSTIIVSYDERADESR